MADFAIINNGACVNVIVAEPAYAAANFPGAIDIDAAVSPRPGIGWSYNGTAWTAPAPPAPSNPVFTSVEFMNLFTAAELQAILNCQTSILLTSDQKQKMNIFLGYFQAANATGIDMTHANTIAGVGMCEAFGLINTGRAAEVIATRH